MVGQTPCRWTALRCRERDFQQFLDVDSEAAAAEKVRAMCEIESRADLDRDPTAAARWNERIRQPYQQYLQDQITKHSRRSHQ